MKLGKDKSILKILERCFTYTEPFKSNRKKIQIWNLCILLQRALQSGRNQGEKTLTPKPRRVQKNDKM